MTVTVEAGCTVTALQQALARHGQRLALDPLWPEKATVGGVLASNDSGPLRAAFGSLRDLVLGVTVALPDGTLARSGGKVVKNVAGYDLPKLMTGALGTLGVITHATFRLHPLPRATRSLMFAAPSPQDANRFTLALQDSTLPLTGLQVVAGRDAACQVTVRVEGSPAAVDASAQRVASIAAGCGATLMGEAADTWTQRERLWEGQTVSKVTFLPSRIGELCRAVERVVPADAAWGLVAQAVGTGLLAVSLSHDAAAADTLTSLRRDAAALGGSLVVLRCSLEVRRQIDVWGEAADALPLMRRIKQQFDPTGVLNPGRFVGGI
jgi:glycolate oxidase FAD binding subunit